MKYKTITLLIITTLLVIPIISAESSYIFKQYENVTLCLPVFNSDNSEAGITTSCYLTLKDSEMNILIHDQAMTFNSSGLFCYGIEGLTKLNLIGKYPTTMRCDDGADYAFSSFTVEVTGTGFEFSQARSIFFIGLLALLVFFFLLTVYSVSKVPDGNVTDDYGILIGINNLKYLKPILVVIAWGLLLGITFISSGVASAYLGSEAFGNFLFVIWRVMFYMTLPCFLLYFLFIFIQVFRDKETKKMIERGIEIPTP